MTNLVKAAKDLPEIAVRRYERASILLTSNRLGEDWAKLPAIPRIFRLCE